MTNLGDTFSRASDRCRQRAHQRWHHHHRKQQILRSQVGFGEITPIYPIACTGCRYYQGQSYGQQEQRQALTCTLHPDGWQDSALCPDRAVLGMIVEDAMAPPATSAPALAR